MRPSNLLFILTSSILLFLPCYASSTPTDALAEKGYNRTMDHRMHNHTSMFNHTDTYNFTGTPDSNRTINGTMHKGGSSGHGGGDGGGGHGGDDGGDSFSSLKCNLSYYCEAKCFQIMENIGAV
jgi:hypothetical protein